MVAAIKQDSMLSERVAKEKEELLSATPRIEIERLKAMLEVYEETEGQPPITRVSRLFHKLCLEKEIFIDHNPIVGTLTKYKYGSYPMPEVGCRWMKRTDKFALQRGYVEITDEERSWIDKAADYWADMNIFNRTKEIIFDSEGVDIGVLGKCGLGTELTPGGFMDGIPDYEMVLKRGLQGLIDEANERKASLDTGDIEDLNKFYFYQGAILCLEGMVKLSRRYALLAKKMSQEESDPERKEELERIARTCEWVPANPARDFHEALQSTWYTILGIWMGSPTVLFAPPSRFTQYMYPFYKRDMEEGNLSDEAVIELLQFFFLKLNGLAQVLSPHGFAWSQSRLGFHLCLGGVTSDGEDATNDLDFLVIEAQRRIQLPEPLVDVLYHDRLSDEFLLKCVELLRTGIGQPAFHNVDKGIQRHLYHDKMSIEEARNMSILGCVQSNVPGFSAAPWETMFNTAKMVELALNNGKDPLSRIQLGPETGDPESFKTYEEFYGAVIKQLKHFMPIIRKASRTAWNVVRDFPVPFNSAVTNDCIEVGKDLADGGARYHAGNAASMVAGIDAANSLAAIKSLVFEEKKIGMKQLIEALDADFEGHEDIRRLCIEAPKYGNDDNYADKIAKEWYEACWEEHQKYPDYLGRAAKAEAFSVTTHFATGRFTGALPSGRKAGIALTDGTVSAMPGTDKNGPTALIRSAARVIDTVKFGGNHFNMKFHPTALDGRENARKFMSLIKTYFDLGGYHAQFNCVSSENLKDAQLHPEDYRDLIVRVAGFSAFFIYLDKGVQDEIIKRT
ncbi:MAG: pyruvate formate lyase family protein, partial [Thermodesulfobacteriota bacterium]|nr:pyruvate formate lyase family protein [Thermodesulfobacteriota bacterium]